MGALGISQKTIGDPPVVYSFQTMPATAAVHIHVALARVIGEAIKGGGAQRLFGAMGKKAREDGDADSEPEADASAENETEAFASAIVPAIMALSADDWKTPDGRRMMGLTSLMTTMFQYVRAGGRPIDIDVHFTGRGRDLYLVLAESLRHNFAGFLGGSRSRLSPGDGST